MTAAAIRTELSRFDPDLPIEQAFTPPASWYASPEFLELEASRIFRKTWQAVGRIDQLGSPGDYVSGCLLNDPYVVIRDQDRALRGFHNVCQHHAAQVCQGEGSLSEFVCPYHGWTYRLDGTLIRAPGLGRNDVFERDRFSLRKVSVDAWGPFAFIHLADNPSPLRAPLADLAVRLKARSTESLRFVERRSYDLKCNWKVFVDNYLDGGYHVAALHKALAGQLDLDTYTTEIGERVSIQSCRSPEAMPAELGGDFAERIGSEALYAFVYPNLMINRYGPILDTNWVVPLGHARTRVIFDFYFQEIDGPQAKAFIARSIAASHRVQEEDVTICESVQKGLESSAFDRGIYAPRLEQAAYHFHRLLAADLRDERDSA